MTMVSLSILRMVGWKKILPFMLLLLTMAQTVFAQGSDGYVIYIDPITITLILIFLGIGIALLIFAFLAIHSASAQDKLISTYQQTSQAQTTIMNNLAQAITTHLYVQTGIMAEESRHRMAMDEKWFNLTAQQQAFMQYLDSRRESTYEKQVQADIDFRNKIYELIAMQTAFKDIEELNRDKLKAMAIQSAKPYEIEVITTEIPEKKETTTKTQ